MSSRDTRRSFGLDLRIAEARLVEEPVKPDRVVAECPAQPLHDGAEPPAIAGSRSLQSRPLDDLQVETRPDFT